MGTDYLKPFVQGVEELVSTMLRCPCDVADPPCDVTADVSGLISLKGDTEGQVALSFSRETAVRMVAQLLAVDETEVDDALLGDGIGEMANIVAGTAKGRLVGMPNGFKLSFPHVVVSDRHELSLFSASGVVHRRVVTSLGDFSLRVWFPSHAP